MDYANLDKASDIRHATPFVFRVYTANSQSPLVPSPPQHTEDDMSGFFAPSPSMRLSKAQYLEQYGHLRRGGWARGKGLGASMVAHILDRPHGQLGRTNAQTNWEDVAPGDLSPWISATRSLDHAIWDISNRLARGETVVKMAVIRQSKGADAGGWEWSERGKTRSIRGSEVWTMATGEMAVERKEAPYGEKPHWDRAHRRVLACDVNLYYGRICGDSVAADLTFTRETLPFALPSHLLRSAIHPQHHDTRRGWLGIIRWDAPYTDWAQAKRRISSQVAGWPSVCPFNYIMEQVYRPSDAMQILGLMEQIRA